ncbi:MAG TPA: hypothetical protein VFQ22_08630, partial [Longimicrobiales bacterium]|nr:hypothetical protein [Longimicrobiales bacterium]
MPSVNLILEAVGSAPPVQRLGARLPAPGQRAVVGGCVGSLRSAVVAWLHQARPDRVFVVVAESPQAAAEIQADMEAILDGAGEALLYPQKEALPYEESEPHLEIGGLRVEAVEALYSGRVKVLVTTARALQERAPIPARLTELRRTFRVGDAVSFASLPRVLEELGFERVPLVEEVGQFAVRGGILDVFSVAAGDP